MNAFANGIKLTDDLERALIAQEVNHRYGFAPDIHSTSARAGKADLIVAVMLAAVSLLAYVLAH